MLTQMQREDLTIDRTVSRIYCYLPKTENKGWKSFGLYNEVSVETNRLWYSLWALQNFIFKK